MIDATLTQEKYSDEKSKETKAPRGVEKELTLDGLTYRATADWLVLRKKEKPVAEIFYTYYRVVGKAAGADRPITCVFNGGPGAASAYLHLGSLGPKRVSFNDDGSLMKPPARLVDNAESWLPFTDLVFIDPVGTGFSRLIKNEDDKKDGAKGAEKGETTDDNEFYKVDRDLESLGEFISKFLSKYRLWSKPFFLAGESYGGFRVGRLARKLQEGFGVGINGAILISPALELSLLEGTDYNILYWSDLFPSLALGALHHGRSRVFPKGTSIAEARPVVERFATDTLISLLAKGDSPEKTAGYRKIADFLGLSEEFVTAKAGRISSIAFTRELLREQRKVVGLYDASATALDPYPDRDNFQGADPTLFAIERIFTAGINTQLREVLGLETTLDYRLLSMDVNSAWKVDSRKHDFDMNIGATDDLRYGMSLNSHMKVYITHGLYDLITPYFASDRLVQLMKLDPSQAETLTVHHFLGGHMFYAWKESRIAFRDEMKKFYSSAI